VKRSLNSEERAAIVAEARTWLGTRYHHLGDVKGHGVDCAMILVRVYCDLGFAPKFDPRPYPEQWYFHHSEEKYLAWIEKYCVRIEEKDTQPADLIIYQFGRCASHGAIILDSELMLHSYRPTGCVEIRERRAPLIHGKVHSYWAPQVPA
jgi:NlpC/P60 family putative phage cell wall peptidase